MRKLKIITYRDYKEHKNKKASYCDVFPLEVEITKPEPTVDANKGIVYHQFISTIQTDDFAKRVSEFSLEPVVLVWESDCENIEITKSLHSTTKRVSIVKKEECLGVGGMLYLKSVESDLGTQKTDTTRAIVKFMHFNVLIKEKTVIKQQLSHFWDKVDTYSKSIQTYLSKYFYDVCDSIDNGCKVDDDWILLRLQEVSALIHIYNPKYAFDLQLLNEYKTILETKTSQSQNE